MPTRERILEQVKYWEWTWNNDIMRMVDECYAENCEVTDMFRARTFYGREELRQMEQHMLAEDSTRSMDVVNVVVDGNVAALEVHMHWGKNDTVGVAFLTFDEDGLILTDHSYGGDEGGPADHDPRRRESS